MARMLLAATMTLAMCGAPRAEIHTILTWPTDLDKVPCDAWKKNTDGSLTQTGTIVVASSHSVLTGNTFSDPAAIAIVEKKCGAELK